MSEGCAVSEAGEVEQLCSRVLFGKGAVAYGLNVCSVVTHLHPGDVFHVAERDTSDPTVSKFPNRVKFISQVHLQVIGS